LSGNGFSIERETAGDVDFVVLRGEIDVAAAPHVHEALLEEAGSAKRTVVDLEGVSFLDSSGLSVLVTALRRAQDREAELSLCSPSGVVARVLELAGLDTVFHVYASRANALAPDGPATPTSPAS
jgi:anti-anti-sigma factor